MSRDFPALFHPSVATVRYTRHLPCLRSYKSPPHEGHSVVRPRAVMPHLLFKAICLLFLTFASAVVSSSTVTAPPSFGTIPFTYQGQAYSTWYTYKGRWGSYRPLIVLHGGPGFSHDYMIALADLSVIRPVIFYDQIGIARSSHLTDKPQGFFTVDLFLSELKNVVAYFDLNKFDLLGHSWEGCWPRSMLCSSQRV